MFDLSFPATLSSRPVSFCQYGKAGKLLKVIPATMFSLLEQVMQMQAKLNELPTRFQNLTFTRSLTTLYQRLEKDKLKEFSQLDQRFQIAKLTHQVDKKQAVSFCLFLDALASLETTQVGQSVSQ